MNKIILSLFINLFFVHCVLAGVAVVDKLSGQVVDVASDDKSFYGYDRGRYKLVENKNQSLSAGELKYDKGMVREKTVKEKEIKEQTKSWRSDYTTLYKKIKSDLLRDGLISAGVQKKKL